MHISSDKKIIDVVNKIAPEHLELNVKNYNSFVPKIKSSGSVCLGKYAVMAMTIIMLALTTYYQPMVQQNIQVE